jgi:hypothetical protein
MQQRPNGIPESWNIEATKNNFVLNKYNIKDNNKIENDLKYEELKKSVSFKSQYVPESWNLYATTNISQIENDFQPNKNRKQKKYSSVYENMTNILHYNRARNRQQEQLQQANEYHNDLSQNIRRQKIERYVKRKTKQIKQTYPMKEHDLLIKAAEQIYKPISSGLDVLERIKIKKQERAQQKAQAQTIQPFVE